MRKLLSFLSVFVLFAFVGQALAEEGGTIRRITGKHVTMGATHTPTATLDVFAFGFESKFVRVCLHPESVVTYLRFGTATADRTVNTEVSPNGGSYLTIDYTTDKMTVPVSTSAIFIAGQSGDYPVARALPMYASADNTGALFGPPMCVTEPWRTKGIVTHVASGLATVDIWAW